MKAFTGIGSNQVLGYCVERARCPLRYTGFAAGGGQLDAFGRGDGIEKRAGCFQIAGGCPPGKHGAATRSSWAVST
jgi:hypothetical protein